MGEEPQLNRRIVVLGGIFSDMAAEHVVELRPRSGEMKVAMAASTAAAANASLSQHLITSLQEEVERLQVDLFLGGWRGDYA